MGDINGRNEVMPLPVDIGAGPTRLAGQFQQRAAARILLDADCGPAVAVLLCNPLGQEALRCHRAFRLLADKLATIGVPSLRFDYFATGDSPGDDGEGDLARWHRDVLLAHEALALRSGAARIVWIGLRLGACVAMTAAALAPTPPARVILWDPVLDGRRYLEELRAHHAFWTRRRGVQSEALGFLLPEHLREQVAAIYLPALLADCENELAVVIAEGIPGRQRLLELLARLRPATPSVVTRQHIVWCSNEALGSQWVPNEAIDQLSALIEAAA
jgi:pimeloyl-ACP methyl ester carboxylesterase